METTLDDLPAHLWHSQRRVELLRHPEIKALLRGGDGGKRMEQCINFALMVAVFAVHTGVALLVQRIAESVAVWLAVPTLLIFAVTVGAQCAFLSQALNHECSHSVWREGNAPFFWIGCIMGHATAALCHLPWAAYYFGGGHQRHHKFAGSRRDVDADALFYLWKPPNGGVITRLLWLSGAAILIPVAYFLSLAAFTIYDFRANVKEVSLVTLDLVFTAFTHVLVGRAGAVYLFLSSCFSMGLLGHPLVGFWLLQHLCGGGVQPTVSYYGSSVWNWLCLNELLHVEHHDLAGISWRHLPRLRELMPEMYDGLFCELSLFGLIHAWLTSDRENVSWDFACRVRWQNYTNAVASMYAAARQRREEEEVAMRYRAERMECTSDDIWRPMPGRELPRNRRR